MKRGRKTVRQAGGGSPGTMMPGARGTFTMQRKSSVSMFKRNGSALYVADDGVGMGRAEEEQCANNDTFWGIDKESDDRARDRMLMLREFELSSVHEQHCKVIQLQQVRHLCGCYARASMPLALTFYTHTYTPLTQY